MATLRALMIDVDGVVITPRPGGWAAKLEADLGLSREALQASFFRPHWEDVMLGRARLHDRLAPVLAEIAPHLTSRQLAAYWFENDADLDDVLLADLAAARAGGVELHLATVQEHERAAYMWDVLGFRDRFDAIHYAADLGSAKPDPAFYAAIMARTGFAPDELVLIDDRAANVDAAVAAGWGGVLWDGTRRLGELLSLNSSAASSAPR